MAKKRPVDSADISQALVDQLERIGGELNLVRSILDELRSDLQWAVQNGQITFQSRPETDSVTRDETAVHTKSANNELISEVLDESAGLSEQDTEAVDSAKSSSEVKPGNGSLF